MDPRETTEKKRPWKDLVPDFKNSSEIEDICELTDRPWARRLLSESYQAKIRGERQGRHPEYDQYRRDDPMRHLYKAESSFQPITDNGKCEGQVEQKSTTTGVDPEELHKRVLKFAQREGGSENKNQ